MTLKFDRMLTITKRHLNTSGIFVVELIRNHAPLRVDMAAYIVAMLT
jgi:GTP cyclohydrolase III